MQKTEVKVTITKLSPDACEPVDVNSGVWNFSLSSRTEGDSADALHTPITFSTGWKLRLSDGYVLDITASPSMVDRGYMINGGILTLTPYDLENMDELLITMIKTREVDDIETPCAGVYVTVKPTARVLMAYNQVIRSERYSRQPNSESIPVSSRHKTDKRSNSKKNAMY